ncbi:MAG: UDP-2,3-diacylglucosamine diphosphatase [Cytophagales bacterium]|nr:UDP-2,3-diacylglucosamine diphosphatase [Cytophagales bacterium]
MIDLFNEIPEGKKIFFASDFHLGTPTYEASLQREKKIVRWLSSIQEEAHAIFLVGDIFDFWFEYKHAVPKGAIRFMGKLAEISDRGIPIVLFTGNHDMWMFDYFEKEIGAQIYRDPQTFLFNNTPFLVGHGDGLGPKDFWYKALKKVFKNPLCQWLFARVHPNLGIGVADAWSKKSRASHGDSDKTFFGEEEWLLQYCREYHQTVDNSIQYFIFGHRHYPMKLSVAENSTYINLGEWISDYTYTSFDGKKVERLVFEK